MNRPSLIRPDARYARDAGRLAKPPSSGRVALPELTFRAMPPSEGLLMLAREQDALCRAVHPLDETPAAVTVMRQTEGRAMAHEVVVRAHFHGRERCGTARHADAGLALRSAYSELLRALVLATPCPCAAA